MTEDEAYAAYKKGMAAFNAAGIAWNTKGSPHKLYLDAKKALKLVSFTKIVVLTILDHTPSLVENITRNNALLKRFRKK